MAVHIIRHPTDPIPSQQTAIIHIPTVIISHIINKAALKPEIKTISIREMRTKISHNLPKIKVTMNPGLPIEVIPLLQVTIIIQALTGLEATQIITAESETVNPVIVNPVQITLRQARKAVLHLEAAAHIQGLPEAAVRAAVIPAAVEAADHHHIAVAAAAAGHHQPVVEAAAAEAVAVVEEVVPDQDKT